MSKQLIERKERGRLIAQANGLVKRNGETSYTVSSQSGNGSYAVTSTGFGWYYNMESMASPPKLGNLGKHMIYAQMLGFCIFVPIIL